MATKKTPDTAGAYAAAMAAATAPFPSRSEAKRVAALTVAKAEEAALLAKGRPTVRGLGWRPQLPDQRDVMVKLLALPAPPPAYNMRASFQPVVDQGQLGSCTANAALAAVQFTEMEAAGRTCPPLSRLFTYLATRLLEGQSHDNDGGATIRDTFKSLNKTGYCAEKLWPYDVEQFGDEPPPSAFAQAAKHKLTTNINYAYVRPNPTALMTVVAANNPVVFGFTVYTSFMSAYTRKTGIMVYPQKGEKVEGGHAVVIVGYDSTKRVFNCRNSWGRSWGDAGYFTMPFEYVSNGLATDFWTVKSTPVDVAT